MQSTTPRSPTPPMPSHLQNLTPYQPMPYWTLMCTPEDIPDWASKLSKNRQNKTVRKGAGNKFLAKSGKLKASKSYKKLLKKPHRLENVTNVVPVFTALKPKSGHQPPPWSAPTRLENSNVFSGTSHLSSYPLKSTTSKNPCFLESVYFQTQRSYKRPASKSESANTSRANSVPTRGASRNSSYSTNSTQTSTTLKQVPSSVLSHLTSGITDGKIKSSMASTTKSVLHSVPGVVKSTGTSKDSSVLKKKFEAFASSDQTIASPKRSFSFPPICPHCLKRIANKGDALLKHFAKNHSKIKTMRLRRNLKYAVTIEHDFPLDSNTCLSLLKVDMGSPLGMLTLWLMLSRYSVRFRQRTFQKFSMWVLTEDTEVPIHVKIRYANQAGLVRVRTLKDMVTFKQIVKDKRCLALSVPSARKFVENKGGSIIIQIF